jgi:uncharacterized protein (TIGR00299 family) protein
MAKTIYIECGMGAGGDMLTAALLELRGNAKEFLDRLNNVGIPGVAVTAEPSVKCGICGTRVKVLIDGREEGVDGNGCHHGDDHSRDHGHNHQHDSDHCHNHGYNHHDHRPDDNHSHTRKHSHHSYNDIEDLIGNLKLSDSVKKNALEVYKIIADAESRVHGVAVDKIHFHEVGDMDAVADIVGVCMLIEDLAPDMILASPINAGNGSVRCAHGILPVPAPATALILQNVPFYADELTTGELCTPTGAALLKFFADGFRNMPVIRVDKVGYGMGKKDFERANCVRAFLGVVDDEANEEVTELVCNLDDMTPEAVAFAQQILLDNGALDISVSQIIMKKGRAGFRFTCLCKIDDRDKMLSLIFKHTSTIGIREYVCRRYTLQREQTEVQTRFGPVRVKTSRGFGVEKVKYEYDDVARIAQENDLPIGDLLARIKVK